MKITDLKVVYICPDHNPKYHARKEHMDALLQCMGFTDVEHFKSGTEAYPDCLSIATIQILQKYIDIPVLILEDDVEATDVSEFDLDASADAIYFGLSRYGGSRVINRWEGLAQTVPYSESQARVLNMLATHAILYISPAYKRAVISILEANMGTKYYNDVLISRIQRNFMVLALKKPVFYQSSKFNTGNEEHATRIMLG